MHRLSITPRNAALVAALFTLSACGSSGTSRKPGACGSDCDDAGSSGGANTGGKGSGGTNTGGTNPGGGGSGNGGTTNTGGGGAATGGQGGNSTGGTGGGGGAGATDAGTGGGGSVDAGSPDSGALFSCLPAPVADAGTGKCAPGTADCDGNPNDCETNVATDASNCGRCSRVCGATAACTNGLCDATVILDPPAGVASNWCGGAFTATTAYMITCWGNSDLSEVRSVALENGGNVDGTRIRSYNDVTVVALRGILVDGPDVYYGLEGKTGVASNLWKFPLNATGTADVTVGVTVEPGIRFDDLQLIGDTYYWESNNHTAGGQIAPAEIYRRKKTDTASTLLVNTLGVSYNLQVTATNLFWLESRTGTGVRLYRAPLDGTATANIVEVGEATPGSYLTMQGNYLYWTVKSSIPNGKIMRLNTQDPNAVPQEIAVGLDLPEGIRADAAYIYFKQNDSLYRVLHCGGTPERLSPVVPAHDTQETAIYHVDDKYVYFAAGAGFGTSTLVRVAK